MVPEGLVPRDEEGTLELLTVQVSGRGCVITVDREAANVSSQEVGLPFKGLPPVTSFCQLGPTS